MKVDEMVTVRDITLTSTCEHHFVTIDGKATVAYIPKDSVIGLSKINRIVQFFAQRPQVQERLTQQILTRCRRCSAPTTWRYPLTRCITA
jgi:GTP cyclohydrolase I